MPAPHYSGAFLGVRVRLSGRVPRVAYAPRRVKIAQPEGFARCRRKGGGVFYGNCKGCLNPRELPRAWAKQDALMAMPLWSGFIKHLNMNWYIGIIFMNAKALDGAVAQYVFAWHSHARPHSYNNWTAPFEARNM